MSLSTRKSIHEFGGGTVAARYETKPSAIATMSLSTRKSVHALHPSCYSAAGRSLKVALWQHTRQPSDLSRSESSREGHSPVNRNQTTASSSLACLFTDCTAGLLLF
nr:hypothetical protein Iba_chr05aCG11840 [Ipomoea batatas]